MSGTDGKIKDENTTDGPEEIEGTEPKEHLGGVSPLGICEVCGGAVFPTEGGVVGYRCNKCGHIQARRRSLIGGRGLSSW